MALYTMGTGGHYITMLPADHISQCPHHMTLCPPVAMVKRYCEIQLYRETIVFLLFEILWSKVKRNLMLYTAGHSFSISDIGRSCDPAQLIPNQNRRPGTRHHLSLDTSTMYNCQSLPRKHSSIGVITSQVNITSQDGNWQALPNLWHDNCSLETNFLA